MDKSKLIDKWFEQNHALIFNNVEIYIKTGYVKGAFKQMLIEMLQEFEQDVRGQITYTARAMLPDRKTLENQAHEYAENEVTIRDRQDFIEFEQEKFNYVLDKIYGSEGN